MARTPHGLRPSPAPFFLAPCIALLAQSCGVAVQQTPAAPALPVVHEIERNDKSTGANDLGWIKPGDALELRGAVGPASRDPYDGFTLRAWSDLALVLELTTYDPALVDLHIHDPVREETVASFGCGCGELRVELDVPAGAVFQLVVGAWEGGSDWRLRIVASRAAWLQRPTTPRAHASVHALDTLRAHGFGTRVDEPFDDVDARPQWPLARAAWRTPTGRIEWVELRLHPTGLMLAPAR